MFSFLLAAAMVMYIPIPTCSHDVLGDHDLSNGVSGEDEAAAYDPSAVREVAESAGWYAELLNPHLRLSFALNSVLHARTTEHQDIALLDTKPFGKVLMIDGMMQSAEKDEFIYHECLVHPALLLHENPKNVFIMGGGEGSSAREALKHSSVEKVVMCDIDAVVVDFCRTHLTANKEAFGSEKLQCVINDAEHELESRNEKFDVIIGDLTDPVEGTSSMHLYTKAFYQRVIKTKLSESGIFATQSGVAGILSHEMVFTSIYNTIKQSFKYVMAYTAHVPSYTDSCGWVLASDKPLDLDAKLINKRITERVTGKLQYLDGETFVSSTVLNKVLRTAIMNETRVFGEDEAAYRPDVNNNGNL